MRKRNPINRLLSMVLCLCMVLSLLPGIPLVANAAETTTMKIYFRNDWNWTDIKLYFWGSKTATNPNWPGNAMSYYGSSNNQNYYVLEVPTDVTGIIINGLKDNGSGRDQSPDIVSGWYDGITYYMYWSNGNQVKSFNIRDVFACKHPNTQTVAGYAATCTEPGLTDGSKCTDCGEMATVQEVIPALGHSFVDGICSVCSAAQYMDIYFRNDWNWTDINLYFWGSESDENPTWPGNPMSFYDNDGTFDYYVMTVPTDVTGIIVNGIKDDGSGATDQSPDIQSGWHDGIVYYMHWDDGNKVGNLDIGDVEFPCKHPNQETVAGYAADCKNPGLTDGTKCSVCGETIKKQETIPALGHKWNDATCTEAKTCSVCGETEGEALGHGYNYDCDTNCVACGELTRPDAIHVSDSASCKDGLCIYGCGTVVYATNDHGYDYACDTNCVECGEMTRPDAIHVSDSVSCKDGFCIYGCGTVVPATSDHTYDNGCDADCNECGDFRVPEDHCYLFDCDTNCVVCGELTRPEAIHVSDAPSCKDGVCIYGCGTNMPATSDHDWDCYFEQAPSCGYDGAYYYQCLLCGESYEEYPPALGHEEPEYTNNGATHDIDYPCCDDEDDSYLPHSFVDGECACGAPEFINVGVYNEYGVADTITLSNTVATPGQDYVTVISSTVGTGISISGIYVALEDSWYGGGGVFEFDAQTNTLTVFGDYVGEGMQIDVRPYVTLTGHLNGGSVAGDYWEYVFEPDENGKFTYTKYCGAEDEFFSAYETCFVREGYKLVGYNTAADGTGTAYALDAVYTLTEDLEIYLIWECDHKWLDATCTAPKTCSVCGETEGEVLGHVDSDNSGRCDVCNILMQPAKICFATASLEGNIAINFYTLLSEEVAADPDAYMQFTMADDRVIEVYVRDAVSGELNGETYYVFTCAVNAKEMADDVICQFFYEGGSSAEVTYNVKAYGNYIVGNSDDASAKALAQAMLNYGAASQLHFGYNTDNLANSEVATPDYSSVTISGFNAVAGQGTNLAKLYSASLILKSETTLRFFFKVDSSVGSFTVSYNGQTLEVKERSGLYYVDVVGIAAKELNKDVEITINDGTTTANVSFNPMSYCQGVQNDTTGAFSAEMKDLVAALYLYNQAANEYFKEG